MNILNMVLTVLVSHCVGETVVNLAFQKPATMSTVFSEYVNGEVKVGPAGGVDENTGTYFKTDTCACTALHDMEPWWMVDLQGQFRIQSVMLTNRKLFSETLRNFVIEIFTQNPLRCSSAVSEICANHSEPSLNTSEARNFTCIHPITGRFVRVQKWEIYQSDDLLILCDVKVFGMKKTAGCSSPTTFRKQTRTRMTSQNLKIINNASSTECGMHCLRNGGCEAFNYNLDLKTCELLLDPGFEDVMESNNAWSYYGEDLC